MRWLVVFVILVVYSQAYAQNSPVERTENAGIEIIAGLARSLIKVGVAVNTCQEELMKAKQDLVQERVKNNKVQERNNEAVPSK